MIQKIHLQKIVALFSGFLFAIGLAVSGMTQPGKVIGFLQWGEGWDPSLIFVMLGAIPVHALSYFLIKRRSSPLFDSEWHLPSHQKISKPLILGSALFGIGWGLGGYCPGPGLAALGSGSWQAIVFVISLIAGMYIFKISGAAKWNS
ncbi:hypothetical protein D3C87_253040 [compost metagenome]